jgi:hypothetical protein
MDHTARGDYSWTRSRPKMNQGGAVGAEHWRPSAEEILRPEKDKKDEVI